MPNSLPPSATWTACAKAGPIPSATSLHLDVLRDLRRIHSHICSVAYPVLDAASELPARRNAESDLLALAASATHSAPPG
jgi:hypothetical protein